MLKRELCRLIKPCQQNANQVFASLSLDKPLRTDNT